MRILTTSHTSEFTNLEIFPKRKGARSPQLASYSRPHKAIVAIIFADYKSSQAFPRAALPDDPADRGRGIVPDGFDSPPKRMGTRWPGRLGHGLRPRAHPAPGATDRAGVPRAPGLRRPVPPPVAPGRARARVGRGVPWGPAPRRGGPRGARPARLPGPAGGVGCGPAPAAAGAESPVRPGPPRQRPPALRQGVHHPTGSQQAFLPGLAPWDNVGPDPRGATPPATVGSPWPAGQSRPKTGSSPCTCAPRQACRE